MFHFSGGRGPRRIGGGGADEADRLRAGMAIRARRRLRQVEVRQGRMEIARVIRACARAGVAVSAAREGSRVHVRRGVVHGHGESLGLGTEARNGRVHIRWDLRVDREVLCGIADEPGGKGSACSPAGVARVAAGAVVGVLRQAMVPAGERGLVRVLVAGEAVELLEGGSAAVARVAGDRRGVGAERVLRSGGDGEERVVRGGVEHGVAVRRAVAACAARGGQGQHCERVDPARESQCCRSFRNGFGKRDRRENSVRRPNRPACLTSSTPGCCDMGHASAVARHLRDLFPR